MPAAVLGCCMRRCERHRLMWQIAKGRSESKGVYIYGIYVHNVYIYNCESDFTPVAKMIEEDIES